MQISRDKYYIFHLNILDIIYIDVLKKSFCQCGREMHILVMSSIILFLYKGIQLTKFNILIFMKDCLRVVQLHL
jgi:hypothetical protein